MEETVSPQQPDGISNIRSWNVRNAGQSDLTERETERVERTDKSGKTQKEEELWERVAQQQSRGLNTARHCEHKDTESLFMEGMARYGTNILFSFSLRLWQPWSTVMAVSGPACGPRTCTVRPPP